MLNSIFLIGFSGTGKTSVGKLVAEALDWEYIDLDKKIELEQKKPITQIFEDDGEPYFRQLEAEALQSTDMRRCVVSCGGGIFENPLNRTLMRTSGFVVCLRADAATIEKRLNSHLQGNQETLSRPVFRDAVEHQSVEQLLALRQENYALAHWHIQTDYLSMDEVAFQVVKAWEKLGLKVLTKEKEPISPIDNPEERTEAVQQMIEDDVFSEGETEDEYPSSIRVATDSKEYQAHIGWGILDNAFGQLLKSVTDRKVIYLISDEKVNSLYGQQVTSALNQDGYQVKHFCIPVGESSKSIPMLSALYEWLANNKVERGDLLVAFGGGVVGDLVGFVAATYLRGIKLVQIPTSLIAMVDSSIGGKTGINLKQGKNLAGAFYQPEFVLVDTQLLTSLDERCLREGWAEAVKYGLISDSSLFSLFEEKTDELLSLDPDIATSVVETCIGIKADTVSQDERDVLGRRALLNYGHTIGHGLEFATGYAKFLHGEAVSVGMMGAAKIGYSLGMTPEVVVQRQEKLLTKLGLPVSAKGVDWSEVLAGMTRDKKTIKGKISWVFINDIGVAQVYNKVPDDLVKQVVVDLCKP